MQFPCPVHLWGMGTHLHISGPGDNPAGCHPLVPLSLRHVRASLDEGSDAKAGLEAEMARMARWRGGALQCTRARLQGAALSSVGGGCCPDSHAWPTLQSPVPTQTGCPGVHRLQTPHSCLPARTTEKGGPATAGQQEGEAYLCLCTSTSCVLSPVPRVLGLGSQGSREGLS